MQKSTLQFPRDADDWVLYNKKVPDRLKELETQGYKVVIFRFAHQISWHSLRLSITEQADSIGWWLL